MDKPAWVLTVGQPFSPDRTVWDNGRFEYRYFSGNHLLQICIASPSALEMEGFQKGRIHVALYEQKKVLFFLFKIDQLFDWSDQPLSVRLLPESDQEIPDLPSGMRTLLSLVLVDARTGLVLALRAVTYSHHFSALFRKALVRQKEDTFSREEHLATIASVYRSIGNPKALAKAAMVMERAGMP
jgi:hypothetical protein